MFLKKKKRNIIIIYYLFDTLDFYRRFSEHILSWSYYEFWMYIFRVYISSFEKRPDLNSLERQLRFCEQIKTFYDFFSI